MQGQASAQYNLGLRYDNGEGVPQDEKKAMMWYLLAAEQGDADALNNLGAMFASGQVIEADNIVAYALFNLSAAYDDSAQNNAPDNRNQVAAEMSAADIAKAQDLSVELGKPDRFLEVLEKYVDKL